MRAVVYDRYGPPEGLRIEEVPAPTPADDEVRVRVRATTVNRTDCGFLEAEYLAVRVVGGLLRPRHRVLGTELAGEVDAVGARVTRFRVGDRVFGLRTFRFGTHAEQVCVKETGSIATLPAGWTFEQGAAVCDGLMLAHNYLRRVEWSRPRRVLVNGASGSIGSAAVQLAHHHGAVVTATTKTAALELVRSLGADAVLDYTREDFTRLPGPFDVILDAVGKSRFARCRHLLTPTGVYFSTELGPYWQNPLLALVTPLFRGRRVGFPIPTDSQEDILYFKSLLEAGHYRAVIDGTFPLDRIVEAYRYVLTGEKVGNVVITIP